MTLAVECLMSVPIFYPMRASTRQAYPAAVPVSFFARDGAGDPPPASAPGSGSGAPAPGAPPAGWRPPTSAEELQALIDRAVQVERHAYQRQLDDLKRRGAGGQTDEERAELERLRKEKIEQERREAEARGHYDRALDSVRQESEKQLRKAEQDREALLNELRQVRCNDALLAAASDSGAINAQQVARLLSTNVKLDDQRRVVVLDDNGDPWLKAGRNISITDLMEKFAEDNPHLFKAKQGAPAGASGGSHTDDQPPAGLDAQIAEAQAAYDKAHKEADETGDNGAITRARLARRKLEELQRAKKAGGGK